ncbi:T9SS type A sorting domain-containing protein [Dyadobacter sp. LHD-138]|uniref:T9SS type A sorting domain-containing protein n=1 Tax=Dyadobacter sp. LHD-138 TaxID=3071413 RepID=UPI0027E0ECC4|nr:T9SS type A sorting domain-containing protein [Dyadobacter sp. LHD-138]MDQ6477719.1 T9SS type A sorting domain-containing protein [Dyadobacter sp. LHD-138]
MNRKRYDFKSSAFCQLLKKLDTSIKLILVLLVFINNDLRAQTELIINTTGYGFSRDDANGINHQQWDYIKKFVNISHEGQDASVTAVRLHIEWNQYEPEPGKYERQKIVEAVKAIVALKPGMKFALHFPYQRPGIWNDDYFTTNDIAQTRYGNFVRTEIAYTCPSIYSDYGKTRFYAFVDDVLSQITEFYPKLLYVQMGNSPAEEFAMPFNSGNSEPGLFEQKALQDWRTKFLPARFPNKTKAKWGSQEYEIKNAPQPMDGNWNSEMGRDLHRFAGWGLLKMFEGFYKVVKSHSPSIKVLYFISDFGSQQGNLRHMHNSTIPLALQLADGIYSSDGTTQYDLWRKISIADVIKGTDMNKIAAIEFDPEDLGEQRPGSGIDGGIPQEWMPRAYKHGTNYVHIAMHFTDGQIMQLIPALAKCRAQFVNGSYTAPARSAPVKVNIFPKIFTDEYIFEPWRTMGAMNWATTDITPKSIKMSDDGYWDNLWDSANFLPCTFTIQAASPGGKIAPGAKTALSVKCVGPECDGATFSWSGTGITSGSGESIVINAPKDDGNYVYTVKTARSGCSPKAATTALLVEGSLPVTLTKFTADKEGKTTLLNWHTITETNSDHFEVERSGDGKQWSTIGQVKAKGETIQTLSNYTFTDSEPTSGENLYRLKMIDRDESFGYSSIRSVRFPVESTIATYPNPATNKLLIKTDNWDNINKVQVINLAGTIVYESDNKSGPEINVSELAPGAYLVRLITTNGSFETLKFVKKG